MAVVVASKMYTYLGDRMTADRFKNQACKAVRRPDGKCIRGRNGNMLVDFGCIRVIVIAKRLRKWQRSE